MKKKKEKSQVQRISYLEGQKRVYTESSEGGLLHFFPTLLRLLKQN